MIELSLIKKFKDRGGIFKLNVETMIKEGSIVSVYGESGAGKTTLLRLISGLSKPDSGFIKVGDKTLFSSTEKINISTQKRNIGFIFQENALFPNFNVYDNIRYSLKKNEQNEWLQEVIHLTGLKELLKRNTKSLSGGQRQRVTLARALVAKPSILLMDEPLSALDQNNRRELQDLILKIKKKLNLSIILVSHDLYEVIKLSDEIIYLKNGEISKDKNLLVTKKTLEPSHYVDLIGEILQVNEDGTHLKVLLHSSQQIITVQLSEEESRKVFVGDRIKMQSKTDDFTIEKLD